MKILNITSFDLYPISNGGVRVTLDSLKSLVKSNDVTLLTTKKSKSIKGKIKRLNVVPILDSNPLIKFSPISFIKIFSCVKKNYPDLLIFDCPWFGVVGIASKFIFKTPFYIRSQNVEYLRMKRLNKWFWFILKIYEKIVYKYAEKIICISDLDKKTLEEELNISAQKIDVSEYSPDPKVFKKNTQARKMVRKLLKIENKFVVLFFGPLDYKPNIEAVNIIITEIAPNVSKHNKNVKFLIVGINPNNLKSTENIIFTGLVKKMEDYINASDVVIVPLISGGGVRTKILESLACGKKVISTKIAGEGILGSSDETALIIKPISNMYRAIIKILHQTL